MHYFGTFILAEGFVATSAQADPGEYKGKVAGKAGSKQCDKLRPNPRQDFPTSFFHHQCEISHL